MGADNRKSPEGWTEATIGEVTVQKVPQAIPSMDSFFTYIDISSIDNESKKIVSPKQLPGEKAPSRARQIVIKNDVIVSMTRPNLNSVALVTKDLDNSIASTGFDVLRSIKIEPKWLFHHVRSQEFVNNMSVLVQGALYPAIKSADVRDYKIPIPPLNEQKRIVVRIEELQARGRSAREALETIPDLLEQLRQSILAAAFRGDLTRKWREKHKGKIEPATELLKRIRTERRKRWEEFEFEKLKTRGLTGKKLDDTFNKRRKQYKEPVPVDTANLPELPEGWCWASIDELAVVVRGASPRPAGDPRFFGGDIPWITVGPLASGGSPYLYSVNTSVTEEGKSRSRYIEEETLLLTNSGATLGVPKITKIGGCINDGIAALLYVDYPTKLFLYYFFRTITKKLRHINQGAAQPNLNTEIIRNIAIPLSSEYEQKQIVNIIGTMFQKTNETLRYAQTITEYLQLIDQSTLSKAFRGELVPQDPSDEPASVLLEYIQEEKARMVAELKTKLIRRGKKMKRRESEKQDIITILKEASHAMTPEDVFTAGGFDEDSVDEFYEQLRDAVVKKQAREIRKGDAVQLEAIS